MTTAVWVLLVVSLVAGHATAMECNEKSIKDLNCALLFVDYYKLKGEYNDAEKRQDLDPNAYTDLHKRLEKAGVKVGKPIAKGGDYEVKEAPVVRPQPAVNSKRIVQGKLTYQGQYYNQCGADGLYYYTIYRYVVCSNGYAYIQTCPYGTRNHGPASYDRGALYDTQVFCGDNLIDRRRFPDPTFGRPEGYAAPVPAY